MQEHIHRKTTIHSDREKEEENRDMQICSQKHQETRATHMHKCAGTTKAHRENKKLTWRNTYRGRKKHRQIEEDRERYMHRDTHTQIHWKPNRK
jgi:hypothetical protein